jgi:hypothetical protein
VGDVIGVYDDFWVLLNEAWPQTLPDRYYIRTVLQHVSRKAVSVLTANDGSSGNRLVDSLPLLSRSRDYTGQVCSGPNIGFPFSALTRSFLKTDSIPTVMASEYEEY